MNIDRKWGKVIEEYWQMREIMKEKGVRKLRQEAVRDMGGVKADRGLGGLARLLGYGN